LKVFLLAAGYGKRLRPLTLQTPKCLVPIKGKPLLDYWINKLLSNDVNDIYINTHYLKDKVLEHIKKYDYKITILNEIELLGTAGALIKNKDYFLNDDLLVIHADNYCEDNFNNFIKFISNKKNKNRATIMAFKTDHPTECGIIKINKNNEMISFIEKPKNPDGNLANCGIYFFPKKILNKILNEYSNATDLSTEVIPNLVNLSYVYITEDVYIDIGTIEKYNLVK